MLYSVRMRAAQGDAHEKGGKHISGAERLVRQEQLPAVAAAMLRRALFHSRGTADFINLTVETVLKENIQAVACLPIATVAVPSIAAGRVAAQVELIKAGVAPAAVAAGIKALAGLKESLRGAMLVDAQTGVRLDNGERGIRVSRMDIADEQAYLCWLSRQGHSNIHIQEAVVLASKVMSASGVAAELCWSDDPEYVTGYVATPTLYIRFTQLKPYGSPIGGRIFFIKENTDLEQLVHYLQYQPVLINVPAEEASIDAIFD
ncbi:6-carboxyhexanoate--CoA ligase [Sporomusa ovata DSM 2662]|uniref:6-carboxyhexanoate--CoA ligase n=1 Tax=Sporomusa ovata TaxID=2378 RepID=A0A0U1KY32_9FIRM|nr:6-carboxyhexanoate--CoA ligase [Sporomusa ovata]EQB28853.1 6-carboxyhexanoate--CoA ligase [Sporomusa ovata DSM 2662]CQR72276.1 Pimeloyl-CoA synthase [Sporomusa ovata]